jgi:hypothetical protein
VVLSPEPRSDTAGPATVGYVGSPAVTVGWNARAHPGGKCLNLARYGTTLGQDLREPLTKVELRNIIGINFPNSSM